MQSASTAQPASTATHTEETAQEHIEEEKEEADNGSATLAAADMAANDVSSPDPAVELALDGPAHAPAEHAATAGPAHVALPASTPTFSHSPGEAGQHFSHGGAASGSEGDEEEFAGSISSGSSLECTSTPVAIGHDPFASARHESMEQEAAPVFQYGSLAETLLDVDSR